MRNALIILLAITLVGCASSGAGTTQDPCGLEQVQKAIPAEQVQQQQQQLKTGQTVSNQPTMTDPFRAQPATIWNGGAGALTAEPTWVSDRSQSGAPSVAQGLLFPATQQQDAEQQKCEAGGTSPAILTLQGTIHDTKKMLDVAIATGNNEMANSLRADLGKYLEQLQAASADQVKTVNIHYDFNGAYITQGVSSSSTASGKPGSAETTGDGTAATMTPEEIVREAGAVPAVDSRPDPAPVEPE